MSDRPKLSDPQVRAKLAQLKKVGLYNGNLRRKQPTKYGKSVVKKYMDVLEGKATVITVKPPKVKGKQTKGHKLARQEFGETQRVVRNKVVVPTKATETARYAPKKKEIQITKGEYRRVVLKRKITTQDSLPKLKKNQSFRVPFNRMGETAYMYFTGPDAASDLFKLISEYETRYKNIRNHVEVVTFTGRYEADE